MRYFNWIGGVLQGDFGISYASRVGYRREVADDRRRALFNTLFLAGMTALIAVPLSLGARPAGRALPQQPVRPRRSTSVTLTSISFPEFFVAYIADRAAGLAGRAS